MTKPRRISVLFIDKDGTMTESHWSDASKSTETKARSFAHFRKMEGCERVTLRCTHAGDHPSETITDWYEDFSDDSTAPDTTNPHEETIRFLTTYTLPDILTTIQRAIIRGETLTTEWFERTIIDIDRELCQPS